MNSIRVLPCKCGLAWNKGVRMTFSPNGQRCFYRVVCDNGHKSNEYDDPIRAINNWNVWVEYGRDKAKIAPGDEQELATSETDEVKLLPCPNCRSYENVEIDYSIIDYGPVAQGMVRRRIRCSKCNHLAVGRDRSFESAAGHWNSISGPGTTEPVNVPHGIQAQKYATHEVCGGKLLIDKLESGERVVRCPKCGTTGEPAEDAQEAIKLWKERPRKVKDVVPEDVTIDIACPRCGFDKRIPVDSIISKQVLRATCPRCNHQVEAKTSTELLELLRREVPDAPQARPEAEEEPRPCPFCNSPNVDVVSNGDKMLRVGCNHCGAYGPNERVNRFAVVRWNTRESDQ